MATFVTVQNKIGTSCKAIIRRKGHRPLTRTFRTKGEARYWASDQESLIFKKKYQDPRLAEVVSLETAIKKYSEHSRTILKKSLSTLEREKYSIKHILKNLKNETPLSEITSLEISNYQQSRLNSGASSSSVRQELSLLSRMFRIARGSWNLNIENPVSSIDRVPPTPGRERFLSTTEANLVLEEAKKLSNKKFHPFVLLLMHTGMRTGEAAKLKLENIDFEKRQATIWETKTKKPRTVPITNTVKKAIISIEPETDGYLFLKPCHFKTKTTLLHPGSIFRHCWKALWKTLTLKALDNKKFPDFPEIPHFTPHDIRHTAASHLLKQGVDIRVIADILGHSTLSMAMRYTHLFNDNKREHIDKIEYLGEQR